MNAIQHKPSRPWRLGACATALLWLAACGGGGGGGGTQAPQGAEPRQQALAVSQPGELVSHVQGTLRARAAQGPAAPGTQFGFLPATDVAPAGGPSAGPAAMATAMARSGTTVQEAGVDEADLMQSAGAYLYTLHPENASGLSVQVHARAADGRTSLLSQLTLPADGAVDLGSDGMHLNADASALAVMTQAWTQLPESEVCPKVGCGPLGMPLWLRSSVGVQRIDISNPAAASAGERISIDGHLVASRRIGDALYVVTTHAPSLAVDQLPLTATPAQREELIAGLKASDLLPRMRRNGGAPEPLLTETDCYVQPKNASLAVEITTITVFDLRSPTLARSSRCFAGGAEAVYMSAGSLYLATTRNAYPVQVASLIYPLDFKTDIHKFALAGGTVAYKGSGEVRGHLGWEGLRKSYRMSEHNGDLRVLSFTGSEGWMSLQDVANSSAPPPSPALLTVLRERGSDQTLQVVSTLPNATRAAPLGKDGEQVYAVRFVGARGYVVTFRRSDPLYVLDLADAADPKAVGELTVAGFSDTLLPLEGGLLLGVGKDADSNGRVGGVKVALFDVANPAQPSQIASHTFGLAGSGTTLDHTPHGVNVFMRGGVARVAVPMHLALSDTPWNGQWQRGLQRFEVNTATRSMGVLGMLGAATTSNLQPVWNDRSLQIEDQVYYLNQGVLANYAW